MAWHTSNFSVQEASLTGESTPVVKTAAALEERDVPLADRANMVYMGTSVASGRARAIVTGTGMETELGKIAGMIQEIEHETTPLQKKLEQFGKWIVYLCFVLVGLVFLLEWLRGGKIIDVFLTAVSLAVAAIPEGLPAVVTIALALGVQRMVKRHALIRKLPSVETLGCATVICSDKTGTLTRNEMTVQAVYAGGRMFTVTGIGYEPKGEFLAGGAGRSIPRDYPGLLRTLPVRRSLQRRPARREGRRRLRIVGDPTEAALLTAAGQGGPLEGGRGERLSLRRGDSLRLRPQEDDHHPPGRRPLRRLRQGRAGRPARATASMIDEDGSVRPLTDEDRAEILAGQRRTGRPGDAGPGVSPAGSLDDLPETIDARSIENDLTFLGLMAMIDPPREEVKEAIGGVQTGRHPDGHDHRRPQEHGRGHRPRAGLLQGGFPGPDRRGAGRLDGRAGSARTSTASPSMPASRPSTSCGSSAPGASGATSWP